jgi:hypothetical protein
LHSMPRLHQLGNDRASFVASNGASELKENIHRQIIFVAQRIPKVRQRQICLV